MSKPERGDFKGGDTINVAELCKQPEGTFGYISVSEIRVDNADVIVLPHSVTVHRVPPATSYCKVEREGSRDIFGTLYGLPDNLKRPQRIAGGGRTTLFVWVSDGYYSVWGDDLEADLRR